MFVKSKPIFFLKISFCCDTLRLCLQNTNSMVFFMSKQRRAVDNNPLKEWMKENQVSQRQMALTLGLTPGTLNGKVNGWIGWQPSDLVALKKVFGLTYEFVIDSTSEAMK
ncbi:XRE family transcriptional regulator [Bifidobacterium pseudocatenulatum]|jgi:DNA-binding XRE family transcriptional regulator|nr:XRE family transcriptional regulator [Bifidobacterium pseudocatenulatum]RHG83271.1 XRE family transcriptional regulator [Bifidobacterium pseudocatenulatum]RHG96465.1 XRE family transcriptional regulator [Bifidobacterium pseudocatenulatum]CAG9071407.1 hypothetical protein BIFLH14_00251 [Bifidobacterium pseudocatenulatum]CAG9075523.1 hypothetical protein BIFLH13_01178 [Bifidobacterium pseudocatenulatum]